MLKTRNFHQNSLLGMLPEDELNRLQPHLEKITLTLGQSLCESGQQMSHVYFPIDSIVSLLCVMENGASTEIAVVSHEGVVGVSLFMGGGKQLLAEPSCRALGRRIGLRASC